jgi:hypothetical protein
MTNYEIKQDAYRRMTDVEGHFPDHVPQPVISYYLLLTLIYLGSIDRLYERHGWIELDPTEAAEGKDLYMCHGPLTQFEDDVITMLRDETRRRENVRHPVLLSAPSIRAIG